MRLFYILLFSLMCQFTNSKETISTTESVLQDQAVIYSLNEYVTSNIVKQGYNVPWGPTRRVQSSYILLRQQPNGTTYMKITIDGQFAYGGIFKYVGKDDTNYKYIRSDETGKEDYLYVNYPLSVLSKSQKYDESIVMKVINYQTSYGMLLKF